MNGFYLPLLLEDDPPRLLPPERDTDLPLFELEGRDPRLVGRVRTDERLEDATDGDRRRVMDWGRLDEPDDLCDEADGRRPERWDTYFWDDDDGVRGLTDERFPDDGFLTDCPD